MHLAAHTKRPNADSWRLGLWSLNRPEWQIVSLAASAYNLVFVSLYETLGPNVVEYCINHAEVNVRFFEHPQANLIALQGRILRSFAHPAAIGLV
jgi:long-subunit acyl-CoA synthetase (AMP-forming)